MSVPNKPQSTSRKKSTRTKKPSSKPVQKELEEKRSHVIAGELYLTSGEAPPINVDGTMNTPNMVVDSNGTVIYPSMVSVSIDDAPPQVIRLEAERVALILMLMRLIPYGDF